MADPINKSLPDNDVVVVLCVRSDLIHIVGEVLKGTNVKLGMNESLGGIKLNG